jgi:CheY-like chemotaxis protein
VVPFAVPAEPSPPGRRKALVVESNYKSAELIRVQLEAEGFTVIHASSAEMAMAIASREVLALITLDIMMPDVDGWLFLEKLKHDDRLRLVPVIIISILADRSKGFALGAAAVMQSPVSRRELYATLAQLGLSPMVGEQAIRVLVVDDDPKAVELATVRIRAMASQVFKADSGREALEIARRELPDLIVLDLMMPEMDGFEVVKALDEDAATAGIPVVILTAANVSSEDRDRLNGAVVTVLGKAGLDAERFMSEVRRAIAGQLVES